ncbi:MAG TPA: MBL fold metallo-hydrolase [Candidatus Limnocylindrales bacterium]|nr:MBL fold metallo-hydrolase [Candidatus Limnocylindrales bacterium]
MVGGWGGWPAAGGACSGYLLEHDGFRLLIDPGYAVLPKLLRTVAADQVDAVLVSHGHPDHCADLNPLLRARAFMDQRPEPLPVHALSEALDAVLALDRPSMLGDSYRLETFETGDSITIGPFAVDTALLPHPRPNAGFRITTRGASLVYTGDAGPDPALITLARDTDLLLAEASYADEVPADVRGALSSAGDAARQAAEAGVKSLILTHLLPGTDRRRALRAARDAYSGPVRLARAGLIVEVGRA